MFFSMHLFSAFRNKTYLHFTSNRYKKLSIRELQIIIHLILLAKLTKRIRFYKIQVQIYKKILKKQNIGEKTRLDNDTALGFPLP